MLHSRWLCLLINLSLRADLSSTGCQVSRLDHLIMIPVDIWIYAPQLLSLAADGRWPLRGVKAQRPFKDRSIWHIPFKCYSRWRYVSSTPSDIFPISFPCSFSRWVYLLSNSGHHYLLTYLRWIAPGGKYYSAFVGPPRWYSNL